MRLVVLESPYAGKIERNVAYARECVRHCLRMGEAPLASHLLYTQSGVLRDDVLEERDLGIAAGLAWLVKADAMVVFIDNGISPGMSSAIAYALVNKVPVEYRSLENSHAIR